MAERSRSVLLFFFISLIVVSKDPGAGASHRALAERFVVAFLHQVLVELFRKPSLGLIGRFFFFRTPVRAFHDRHFQGARRMADRLIPVMDTTRTFPGKQNEPLSRVSPGF